MHLFKLLNREIKQPLKWLVAIVLVAGLSNALLVEVINIAAGSIANQESSQRYFVLFLLCAGFALYSRKYIFDQAFVIIEEVVNQIRKRIGNKIRFAELSIFEEVGTSPLYARLSQDVIAISDTAWQLIKLIQAFFVVIFMTLYIAILSPWAFVLVLLGIVMSTLNYAMNRHQMAAHFTKLSAKETDFFEKLSHILSGFKEIKINEDKSKAVFKKYVKVNDEKKVIRIKTNQLYNNSLFQSQIFIYAIIAAVIFVVPHYHEEHASTIIKIMAAILFIVGPIEAVWNAIPTLAIAENACKNIIDLEKQLDKALYAQRKQFKPNENGKSTLSFTESIQFRDVVYQYENNLPEHAFSIGPINLSIQKGEIIFIIGGNGSGKSTFLKLFIGLYFQKRGHIFVDRNMENDQPGTLVSPHNIQSYRSLFTTIFTDYHLFDKLYGLDGVEDEKVNELLQKMDLSAAKTRYQNGGFTNIKLSSGQKKRLALVTCILEDKDIYIFDEVAADLDPWFRDTYYYEILAELKSRNKTVFVVSHDKEYWEIADRILEMKNGQLLEKTPSTALSVNSH